jgi:hypothetical protein
MMGRSARIKIGQARVFVIDSDDGDDDASASTSSNL